jgi:nicotinamidase-related amidase
MANAPDQLLTTACAVVVVDMQNGVVNRGIWDPDRRKAVLENCVRLVTASRESSVYVVLVRVERRPDMSDAPLPPFAVFQPPDQSRRLARNDSSSAFMPGLEPAEHDDVVTKRRIDAFYSTDVELLLRTKRIQTLILCGIATNWGVEATARSARDRGFDVILAEDCTDAFSEDAHKCSVEQIFSALGAVLSHEEIIGRYATLR